MTTLREEVISAMGNDNNITTALGRRFYSLRAPQDTKPPYVLLSTVSEQRPTHLRGVTDLENSRLRFDLYGKNYLELLNVRDDIESMMYDKFGVGDNFYTELYEDDTQFFHLVIDFSVWHDRK